MTAMFEAIDLSGVVTSVGAIGVLVIGIAMAMKGISLVKRVVGKV